MPDEKTPIVDPIKAVDAKILANTVTAAPSPAADAIDIGLIKQFVIDDHLIETKTALHRRINQPTKHAQPILVPDQSWEGCGLVYGSVIQEPDDELRLFYKAMFHGPAYPDDATFRKQRGHGKYPICVAVGMDPTQLEKRPIASSPVANSNVVVDDSIDDFCVLRDDTEPNPDARYKMLSSRGNWWGGLTPATSPDGIHWTWGQDHAVTFFGDRCSYWYDPVHHKHVAWSRNYQITPIRSIVHKDTEDFNNWGDVKKSHPHLVIAPDREDHEMTQIYGGYAFWYHSVYIAYLEMYYIHHQRLDTQLACSRDGLKWTRLCHRDVFLPNGPHGSFDGYWAVPTFNAPIERDGKLFIHYNGRPDPHTQPGFAHLAPGMGGAFGVSELREDGFVSLDATGNEGVIVTKPLKIPENTAGFELNACPFNTRAGYAPMTLQIDVLSLNSEVIASKKIQRDNHDETLWHELMMNTTLPQIVRLKISVRNARLYAFRAKLKE